MIQRIQTLYLLVISVLCSFSSVSVLADLSGEKDQIYLYKALGVYEISGEGANVYQTIPVFAILIAIVLISFTSIFMYKKRMLQIRFCIFNGVLLVAFYAIFLLYYTMFKAKFNVVLDAHFMLAVPIIAFALNILTIRAIKADEALVRSLNRIR